MKYLLVFYFAGFLLADAGVIKKYKLFLQTKDNEFQGIVTLTLSDTYNDNYVELDPYDYEVTNCTYTGTDIATNPLPPLENTTLLEWPITQRNCSFENNIIEFNGNRTSEEVVLEFKGQYRKDGLSNHTTGSKDKLYVADMTAKDHKIIFPCLGNEKAEFEFEGDAVVMSNLENLREQDEEKKISLRDLIFIQGDIVKDNAIPPLTLYRMKNSNEMGKKLKNVLNRVAKLKVSLNILFTSVQITSRDLIILSDDYLKPDDSGSDYMSLVRKLAGKLFTRRGEKEKTFLDSVGPEFAITKITGVSLFTPEWPLKFFQIRPLEEDGFNSSKSLNDLTSTNQDESADLLFYTKGISVLYSLDSLCGDEKFMEGLSNYIKNKSSTVDEAFVGCFESNDKAKQFFEAWIGSPGYPVVHVTLNKAVEYSINQERFLWFGSPEKDRRWNIPIYYKTKEGAEQNITLPATKDMVNVTINSTYFILDHYNTGFYRVNYDAKVWQALIPQLKSNHTVIDPASRMRLINDVFSFPRSTYNFNHNIPDYVTALKLSEYLRNETNPRVLQVAFDALGFLDSALNSSYHGKFRDHMKGILNGIYNKTAKGHIHDAKLQDQVILLACRFGVEECITNASRTFNEIPSNATTLSKQQIIAICSVIRVNSTSWMDSVALLSATDMESTEKIRWLGCSRDKTILSLFLTQFIVQKDKDGFKYAVFHALENNPDNTKLILDIIKRFENAITKAFGKKCLMEIVLYTLPKLNSESAVTLKEIAKNLDEQNKKIVNMLCDNVILWTNTKAKRVGDYFKTSGGSQAKPIALVLLAATFLPLANHIFHS